MDLYSLFKFDTVHWIILAALLLFFIIQLLFYFLLYRKPYIYELKREKSSLPNEDLPPVSIIIASKNESEYLAENLPKILDQDYPEFEVIVVNTGSTDETDMVLKRLELDHKNLYHTYVPNNAEPINEKKLALTLGIKAAKNDLLIFAESYCAPCSNQWIREYANAFAQGKDIVLGYCKFNIKKSVPMRRFVLYDNLIHCLKYLSMAVNHKPFMGIGRNMGYRRNLFFDNKGFSSILNIEGGEDDLFINTVANKTNTTVVTSPESMTESSLINRFSTWRELKSKYMHTKQFYKGFQSGLFNWESITKYGFYTAVFCAVAIGVIDMNYLLIAGATLLFIFRWITQIVILNKYNKLFKSGKYFLSLLYLDILQPINNLRFKRYARSRGKSLK
ncbi:MAG: glycosyltransferase [Dysgonamonadaceae bacterium]